MVNEYGERFVDLIPDPKAESDIDRLAEDSFIHYLHDLIYEAISETKLTEKQKQVLMIETSVDALRSLSDRLEMTGCNTRQQYTDLKGKAFKHLRKHSKIREAWKAFRVYGCDAEIASASFHRSPEAIVILQEKQEQRMKSARKKVKADILNTVNHSDILRLSDEELELTQQEEESRQADDREAFEQLKARMLELKAEFEESGIWYPSLQKKFAEYGIDFSPSPPPETVTADPPEA